MIETKVCSSCNENLPVNNFHKRESGRIGYMSSCKVCTKQRNALRYKNKKNHIQQVNKQYREIQKSLIHNNWDLYFTRLVKRIKTISKQECIEIYKEQKGLCALSGVPLTCLVGKSREHPPTNASVDRIIPGSSGGEYIKSNIRLVCTAVNMMRSNYTDEEFLWWSHQVVRKLNGQN